MVSAQRLKGSAYLLGCLVSVSMLGQTAQTSATSSTEQTELQSRVQNNVVFSAKLGEINVDTSIYQAYSNAEISARLNEFHKLSPHDRREILLEVSRRIREHGEFKVEKHEQRFGRVVSSDLVNAPDPDEPKLEEIVVARLGSEDDEAEPVPAIDTRKSRTPVRRVSSGRAYTQ